MILAFSTLLNGKPTYFVEKILKSIQVEISKHLHEVNLSDDLRTLRKDLNQYILDNKAFLDDVNDDFINKIITVKPKLHSIREDKNNRWKRGTKIDFFINCRQKDMFRFAPVLHVVRVQKIEIKISEFANDVEIRIDGKLLNTNQKQELALNDGFENLWKFLMYFNEDFTGKIIHWTDLKY